MQKEVNSFLSLDSWGFTTTQDCLTLTGPVQPLHVNRDFSTGFWNISTAWAVLPTPFLLRVWLPDGVCDRNQGPRVTTHLETGPSSPLHGNTGWGDTAPLLVLLSLPAAASCKH